jgi:hypothetical protein
MTPIIIIKAKIIIKMTNKTIMKKKKLKIKTNQINNNLKVNKNLKNQDKKNKSKAILC